MNVPLAKESLYLLSSPINSDIGQDYYKAMACAVNYAFCNRQMIMHWTRDVFKKVLGLFGLTILGYDDTRMHIQGLEFNVNDPAFNDVAFALNHNISRE